MKSIRNPFKIFYGYANRHYQYYRQQGTSRWLARISTLMVMMGWLFFKLESKSWHWIRKHRSILFPQIKARHRQSGDWLRYLIQSLWLLFVLPKSSRKNSIKSLTKPWLSRWKQAYQQFILVGESITLYLNLPAYIKTTKKTMKRINDKTYQIPVILFLILSILILILTIVQPLPPAYQFILLIGLWAMGLYVRHRPGKTAVIVLAMLSILASCRYLWWRYTATLAWEDTLSLFFGMLLLIAETYVWLVLMLGFFQSIWPLQRPPVSLPKDTALWPTIDLMIPTYNEDLSVLKPGVYAALGLDWPKDKLQIYILDDGHRAEFETFAKQVGVGYIARSDNRHAKAGNINHALTLTRGELIAIFDCDYIAARSFLQLTVGWFLKDPKLAFLQTPHHFFSADPYERNLNMFMKTPNESALFYGVIQDGNDLWNAAFFCGSAGLFRRTALEKIGGIAVQTVTEDAHTSIKLHQIGYRSAYLPIPLSAGLSTESLSGYLGQRMRWARGMMQILRLDNPLIATGLSIPQRLCYFNAMLYFLSGISRLIFFISPMAFLIFHAYIIDAPAYMVVLYGLPHIVQSVLANDRIQGKYRHLFWNEIYETVVAWKVALPAFWTLFSPYQAKFNVTAKGGLIQKTYRDWALGRPYFTLIGVNVLGLIAGIIRLIYGPPDETLAILLGLFWVFINLMILGGALGVDMEAKQIRHANRVEFTIPAALAKANGHVFPCLLSNYSSQGVGINLPSSHLVQTGDEIALLLKRNEETFTFPGKIVRVDDRYAGIYFSPFTLQQEIQFMQCTFARSDTWAQWFNRYLPDKPINSLKDILKLDLRGYLGMMEYAPLWIKSIMAHFVKMILWLWSFLPRTWQIR